MRAICKNPVVKQETEGKSFTGSVSVLTAPLAATAVIKSVTAHLRRCVEMSDRGPEENPARILGLNLEAIQL